MEQELTELAASFKKHADQDSANFEKIDARLANIDKNMARIANFFDSVDLGEKVVRWWWKNLANIGSAAIFFIAVWAVFKFGIMGAIHYFFKLVNGN
jgi:ABC-type multidrug transport system fused ATPase/permease subunit